MSDWISQMANAVEEHEAANAAPQSTASMPGADQDEVPTEPATSPRSQVVEVPLNDGRWTTEESVQNCCSTSPRDLNERDQVRLQELCSRQATG